MKRRALFILVLLVAGTIVNVAVAWGCALLNRGGSVSESHLTAERWLSVWTDFAPDDWPCQEVNGTRYTYPTMQTDVLWGSGGPPDQAWMMYVSEFGWPIRSMRGAKLQAPGQGFLYLGLIDSYETLPLYLNWPRFAINTVFYAFILWLLFAAPLALRRRRRIKRGLCPKCAHPVGTNAVCTECGAARVPRTRPHA